MLILLSHSANRRKSTAIWARGLDTYTLIGSLPYIALEGDLAIPDQNGAYHI